MVDRMGGGGVEARAIYYGGGGGYSVRQHMEEVPAMADRPFISMAQAQAAMNAMIAKANELPDEPVAMCILDDSGNMVAYAHMDNLRLFSKRHAFRKAYTSAITGTDSVTYGENAHARGSSVPEMSGDGNFTPGQGGVAVRSGGVLIGGIGVGGYPSGVRDEELSRVGLAAMGL